MLLIKKQLHRTDAKPVRVGKAVNIEEAAEHIKLMILDTAAFFGKPKYTYTVIDDDTGAPVLILDDRSVNDVWQK